jgi:hypothetical protein
MGELISNKTSLYKSQISDRQPTMFFHLESNAFFFYGSWKTIVGIRMGKRRKDY